MATRGEISASIHEVVGLVQLTANEAGDAAVATEKSSAARDEVLHLVESVDNLVVEAMEANKRFKVE